MLIRSIYFITIFLINRSITEIIIFIHRTFSGIGTSIHCDREMNSRLKFSLKEKKKIKEKQTNIGITITYWV